MALGGFSSGGSGFTGGATGADDYYSKRFDTYAKYLTGVTSPEVMANLAQSDTLFRGAINSFGARPSNAYGVSQLIHYAQDRQVPAIPVEKIPELKQYLKDRGWVHPDTPITDYWGPSDPYYEVANRALGWERDHPESAPQPGQIQTHGIFQWLGDINLSKVFQSLAGMGKQATADLGYVLNARPLMNLNPEWKAKYERQNEILADVNKKIADKKASGGIYTYRDFMQDYNIKKLDLNLRKDLTLTSNDSRLDDPLDEQDWIKPGAEGIIRHQFQDVSDLEGVLAGFNIATLGIEGSVAAKAIDPALRVLGEQWAKGGAEAAFRVIPTELEKVTNRSLMNKLVTFSTGKMGWEEGADMFKVLAKPLWSAKSTAAGGLVTAGLTAATKVSITSRLRGAAESGYIFPNVNPLELPESQLSKSIGNAPILGKGIALGPAGDDRFLGNVVDLTGFIWAPESFLPVRFRDITNGVSNMVGRNELAPLQQLFKSGRKDIITNLGGEAATSTFLRYLKVQAHLRTEAYESLRLAGKKAEDGPAFREAYFRASTRLSKGGSQAIEDAIRGVTPEQFAKTSISIFAEGHGDPVSWGRAHQILRDVEVNGILKSVDQLDDTGTPLIDKVTGATKQTPIVTVDDFRSASGRKTSTGVWGKANQEALDDIGRRIHQATSPKTQTTAGGMAVTGDVERRLQQSNLSAAKRLGEVLTGDERLIFTRADKPLSTAQSISQWYSLNLRLRRLFPQLSEAVKAGEEKLFRYGYRDFPYMLDLKNAGFTDAEVQDMRTAAVRSAADKSVSQMAAATPTAPGQQTFPVDQLIAAANAPTTKADLLLTGDQVARLHASVDQQLIELGQRLSDNHPQFKKMLNSDSHIDMSRANRKALRQYSATLPRAVTIHDPNVMNKMLDLGYEPAIGSPDMITLRDVGTGDIEKELGHAGKMQGMMDFLGLGNAEPRQKVLQTLMQKQLNAELGDQVARGNVLTGEVSGEGLHNTLKDIARKAEIKRSHLTVNSRPLWKGGQIFDLRSLTVREIQEFGALPKTSAGRNTALDIQGAIRRGYAYGNVADIRHPLTTMKATAEMFGIRGLPGVEDLIRTLGTKGADTFADRKVLGKLSGVLRVPDKIARTRDFMQFALNPIFTLQNAAETMQMRAFHGVPHTMPWKAEEFVANFAVKNRERFAEIMSAAFGDSRGTLYSHHAFDDLYQLVDRGFFGLNLRANEMADAIKLAERGEDLSTIGKKVERIYRYGPGLRSPFMSSINYLFFPFSFNMKYASAAVGWMNQQPTRAMAIHAGLAAWYHLNETGKLKDWQEQHLPILTELNKLNSLGSGGLGFAFSPIGGRNKRVYDAWKASQAVLNGLGAGPAPFVPMAISEQDRKDAASVIKRAVPMIKQAQDLWKESVSQAHAFTEGGSDDWQVSNFMEDKRALDDEISADMESIGLIGGRGSVGTKAMVQAYGGLENAQNYTRWIQEQEKELARKYPQGKIFSDTYVADSVKKSQELSTLAEQPYKTSAENAILYFAAETAREEMFADLAARQHTMNRKQLTNLKIEVSAAAAQGLPVADIPGKLTSDQVQGLRSEAVRLAAAEPDFEWLYNRYFYNSFGAISVHPLAEQS
jgi:hypothetical protein